MDRRLGIVTGMRFERAILTRWRGALGRNMPMLACAGASYAKAREDAELLVAQGADALISFGIAGALAPGLVPGTLLLPRRVLDCDGNGFDCDAAWCEALKGELPSTLSLHEGVLASVQAAVTGRKEKQHLRETLSAGAVDMESGAVAAVAHAHGVPFIAVRAVADTADQALPGAALAAARPDGSVNALGAALTALRRPGQIPDLVRLGRQSARAKRTLNRVAHAGLPFFGLV